HPHATDRVAVVHNGIIENFQELRDELTAQGHVFETETDTETVAHLLTRYLDEQKSPEAAMEAAMARLRGAFALAIIFGSRHDLMIGARRGSPLVVGYGDGEMFLGSDALALAPLTRKICYLEENDWAVVRADGATIHHGGEVVDRPVKQTALSGALIGKGDYRHFMLKEIHEQPEVVGDTLRALVNPLARRIELPALPVDFASLKRLTAVACGTAYLAGLVGKYWFEQVARLPIDAARARGVLDAAGEARLSDALLELPGRLAELLQDDSAIRAIAPRLAEARDVLFLGRGSAYPIALEGALKLKELSYIHAEGY